MNTWNLTLGFIYVNMYCLVTINQIAVQVDGEPSTVGGSTYLARYLPSRDPKIAMYKNHE